MKGTHAQSSALDFYSFSLRRIFHRSLRRPDRDPAGKPTTVKPAEKAPEKLGTHAIENLPSEATVDSFLHQQFGYQPELSWKISSIRPSPVAGLAEVTVVLASQQGQQLTRFYVCPDGEHAFVGDIIPFGARPFDPAQKKLEKGITGPGPRS